MRASEILKINIEEGVVAQQLFFGGCLSFGGTAALASQMFSAAHNPAYKSSHSFGKPLLARALSGEGGLALPCTHM